jgi:hypothetical protein
MERSIWETLFRDGREIAYEDAVRKTATNTDEILFSHP